MSVIKHRHELPLSEKLKGKLWRRCFWTWRHNRGGSRLVVVVFYANKAKRIDIEKKQVTVHATGAW